MHIKFITLFINSWKTMWCLPSRWYPAFCLHADS